MTITNTDLRAKLTRIRTHRHWRYAMRHLLLSYGIPESEIESRLATLTQEIENDTEERLHLHPPQSLTGEGSPHERRLDMGACAAP